jgi:hypothetical protein
LYFEAGEAKTGILDGVRWMLVNINDAHDRLFGLYHEMGHILHNDLTNDSRKYVEIYNKPYFKSDIARIQRYLDLGKKSIPKNTYLASYLEPIKQKYQSFWIKPKDQQTYLKMLYERGKEQRADLYAFDMIAKYNLYDSLIAVVYKYALSGFVVVNQTQDDHPSNVERAFCMLGFMADKHVNLQALALKYEKNSLFKNSSRKK